MGGADPKIKQKYSAALLSKVRPLIDDAIEKAGGTGWRDYLRTFEQGMRQVEQKQMAAKALGLLETSPRSYEKLVSGNAPERVEKVFGTQYDIKQAMGEKYPPMRGVLEQLARDRGIAEGAARGQGGLTRLLEEHNIKFILPNWIDREIALTNRILLSIEKILKKSTVDALQSGMKSGRAASEILNALPTSEKMKVVEAFLPYMQASGVSAFSGQ